MDTLETTAEEIAALGVKSTALQCDVTDSAQVADMVEQTIERLGGLHILINNAGIIIAAPVLAMEEEQWDAVMNVNLKGVFLCCKAVIPHMLDQRLGRIINISSIAGKRGHGGVSAYGCSKAGVISLTQCLAEELGPFNITVNSICPGYLETTMWTGCLTDAASAVLGVEKEEAFMAFVKENSPFPCQGRQHHRHRAQHCRRLGDDLRKSTTGDERRLTQAKRCRGDPAVTPFVTLKVHLWAAGASLAGHAPGKHDASTAHEAACCMPRPSFLFPHPRARS